MAAPVCLYVHFRSRHQLGSILKRGVARRSFGLVRFDLLSQIDPSVTDPSGSLLSWIVIGIDVGDVERADAMDLDDGFALGPGEMAHVLGHAGEATGV
jgi:hypothetical protein